MQSLALAICDIMTALLVRADPPPTPKKTPQSPFVQVKVPKAAEPPQGYMKYNFKCWLCSGDTAFSCPTPTKDLFFNLECCRCGMANKVKVVPPVGK